MAKQLKLQEIYERREKVHKELLECDIELDKLFKKEKKFTDYIRIWKKNHNGLRFGQFLINKLRGRWETSEQTQDLLYYMEDNTVADALESKNE